MKTANTIRIHDLNKAPLIKVLDLYNTIVYETPKEDEDKLLYETKLASFCTNETVETINALEPEELFKVLAQTNSYLKNFTPTRNFCPVITLHGVKYKSNLDFESYRSFRKREAERLLADYDLSSLEIKTLIGLPHAEQLTSLITLGNLNQVAALAYEEKKVWKKFEYTEDYYMKTYGLMYDLPLENAVAVFDILKVLGPKDITHRDVTNSIKSITKIIDK